MIGDELVKYNDESDSIKFSSISEAFSLIKDNDTIVTAMAASEPQLFYRTDVEVFRTFRRLNIYCANPSEAFPIFEDESLLGHIELRPMFLTSHIKSQQKSHVHYVPCHLSQWVKNIFLEGEVDVFWGSCSLPDRRGFVSLGPSNCYEYEILRKAKKIILELNPNLPYTLGATSVPCSKVDVFLKTSSNKLSQYCYKKIDENDLKIAEFISELIDNGATIQLGIGAIPNALAEILLNKKDLGVHTEMINDAILKLARNGVVTGKYKTMWPDKIIGSFAYGSHELYEFIDRNPIVELYPSSLVNDPMRIGRNYRMVSVNSAVEIDITGQVVSESIGHIELSGIGGAFDTHTGAQRSEGGRGIIALQSMTKNFDSKIVSQLKPGAKVSISRNDIDTVITEYGIAKLKGLSVAQRAHKLINIAHPSFRDQLIFDAKKNGYI